MLLLAPAAAAQACGGAADKQVESSRYAVAYRTQPDRIPVGRHFSVEFSVCPKAGAPAPENVTVDAHMPEHRHGMNYKPQVTTLADGRYRAEGLMFHMPGRWEFMIDVRAAGRTDRLTPSLVLE